MYTTLLCYYFVGYDINTGFMINDPVQRLNFSALMSLWCKWPVSNSSMQRKGVLTAPPFGKSNGITMLLITTELYINVIYTLYTQ